MLSYVYMKILEGRPASYDRRINRASGGEVRVIKRDVVGRVEPGSRVLEIGCGTGEMAAMLTARGCRVDGFDQNHAMVKVVRERIAREGLDTAFSVCQMGVDGMDGLPALTYDAVVSTLVFSELSAGERRFALQHCARVLKPGALLLIADEVVPRKLARRLLHVVARAPALAVTYLATGAKTEAIADLAGEIQAAGFTIDQELRSQGDAFALISAHSTQEEVKS